jgi:farnesyl diphosphate synthase
MAHSVVQLDKEENKEMMAVWPDIVRDITETARNLNIPDVADWMEKVIHID